MSIDISSEKLKRANNAWKLIEIYKYLICELSALTIKQRGFNSIQLNIQI